MIFNNSRKFNPLIKMKNEVSEITDGVKNYFGSLKNSKPLTKKVEKELIIDYKENKNLASRNKLITANLRYACKLASAYRNRGVSFEDLISEANDGLIEAIEKFDVTKDVKLISYSKWWIMQRMQAAIEKRNRMPESELPTDTDSQMNDAEDDEPQVLREGRVDDAFIIGEEVEQSEASRKALLENLMCSLTDRENDIINMYYGRAPYGDGYTLGEIGKKYNLTKERIRQIIERSFRKIRSSALMMDYTS